jgi:5-methylthioadenosine/S-adenosylhomocysteine deaminase
VDVRRVLERTGKSSTEVLDETGLLNDRLMGGQCIHVTASDARKLAEAVAHAVHIPKCNAASGRLAPTPMLKRAGVNIALATDTQHGDMVASWCSTPIGRTCVCTCIRWAISSTPARGATCAW